MEGLSGDEATTASHPTQMKWKLYLPKAFHPLLLQRHQENLQKAMKDVSNAKSVSYTLDKPKEMYSLSFMYSTI